jgi:hypothetical protein
MVRNTGADELAGWDPTLVAVCVCADAKTAAHNIAATKMVFTRFSNLGEIERLLIVSMVGHARRIAKGRKD